ncbi:hypothetical protein BDN70DRAFT_872017 [Pholiota conissans]|uniref:Uncharacterized protein n=1 Tax=Pholiota conissans TaxID=109636 RepID=A0A9P5ZF59_9AGAR|nr:hypothetical protein BDN70DRAFT_872017 [Pholiota conissans]
MSAKDTVVTFDPSQYEHLPLEFQPPQDGGPGYLLGKPALLSILPVARLPKGLLPKRGLRLQPPRFHYGWAYREKELFEMAKRCGFLVVPPDMPMELRYMDDLATQDELGRLLREQLGIHSCTPKLYVAFSRDSSLCISLTTNYKTGNRPPPQDDVQAIQDFLGIEQPPAWFVDAEGYGKWQIFRI